MGRRVSHVVGIDDSPFEAPTAKPGYPDSYYVATAKGVLDRPCLAGELRCDVCVIGGGFTGLSAALHLAERGFDVVLLEACRIGWGASGRNGGQLGSGFNRDQQMLEGLVGKDDAHRLWHLSEEAKAIVKDRIARHLIDCDLKAGILHPVHKSTHAAGSERYVEKLRSDYGYPGIRSISSEEMGEMLGTRIYHGGSLDTGAAHLHPLNYALGLARAADAAGVRLFEGTRVLGYSRRTPATVRTSRGVVTADFLVLAGEAHLAALEPRIAAKVMPINSFMLATRPLGDDVARRLIRDDVAVADARFVVSYFRLSVDKRLLFGGGETYTNRFPRDIKSFVRRRMLRVFPQLADARIDFGWGGTLAITLRRLPHLGRLPPNVFFAQGYGGQGVALSSLAGKLIAEALAGTAERFDVFSRLPTPTFPGGTLLRWPALMLGMLYYVLRDEL